MDTMTEPQDPYYIQATSSVSDDLKRVLKHDQTFAVFDHYGDILPIGLHEQGLFHEGTRFLSRWTLAIHQERPLLLSSTITENNALLAVDLMNPDVMAGETVAVPRGALHLARTRFLWQGICHERLVIRNYSQAPARVSMVMTFEADFADIFEVRGLTRFQRGQALVPLVEEATLTLAYQGLDGVVRRTSIASSQPPARLSHTTATFDLSLPAHGEDALDLTITCLVGDAVSVPLAYEQALAFATSAVTATTARECHVTTDNEDYNALLRRSVMDLRMLTSATPHGPYPHAGVPWFSTPFGRDGLIVAFQCLWLNPALAHGVLSYLAATQARAVIPEQDAEPGKILHETRDGEMAALGEIPFGRYYGSIDATPLFVVLAGAYYQRTGDRAFIEELWPAIDRALTWIDRHGDVDGDGFIEYQRATPTGLRQQGWKDSHDSVFHADGHLAEGPIALCEAQAYVYAAWQAAADLADALDEPGRAAALRQASQALQARFEAAYWCEDLGMYALALDGHKQPCRVRSSNAGHCLVSGIASPARAKLLARALLADDLFSGWGVRTLSTREVRYNPMSYHNGSVWPHDTSLIAYGLARHGMREEVGRLLTGLADASMFVDLHRLPELFCGFARRGESGPVQYPVACAPQAWAAGSIFLLLQACLGLSITGTPARVVFTTPVLPAALREVVLTNLAVNDGVIDLAIHRHEDDVTIAILRRQGDVEVVIVK